MAEGTTMKELGKIIREQEAAVDERLELLAEGTLSSQEAAELREALSENPELYEAFEPLGSEIESRLVEIAHAGLSDHEEAATENVVPLTSGRRWRRMVAPLMAVAAAAALVAIVPQEDPLPKYDYAVLAADKMERGDFDAEELRLRNDSIISMQLRPNEPITGDMEAAVFVRINGVVHKSDLSPEVSASGAVRVRGRAFDVLGITHGKADIALVVCRVGLMPDAEEVFHAFPEDPDPRCWRARYWTVEVLSDEEGEAAVMNED